MKKSDIIQRCFISLSPLTDCSHMVCSHSFVNCSTSPQLFFSEFYSEMNGAEREIRTPEGKNPTGSQGRRLTWLGHLCSEKWGCGHIDSHINSLFKRRFLERRRGGMARAWGRGERSGYREGGEKIRNGAQLRDGFFPQCVGQLFSSRFCTPSLRMSSER